VAAENDKVNKTTTVTARDDSLMTSWDTFKSLDSAINATIKYLHI